MSAQQHPPVSFQTVRLSKGKHRTPDDGACVMELASMLSGETFSDRPESACPVIAGFMRAYNDAIDDTRRQDLYAYASRVVGTRGGSRVERLRGEACLAWAESMRRPRPLLLRWLPSNRARSISRRLGLDAPGTLAAKTISRHTDETHRAALALIDELIATRAPGRDTAGALELPTVLASDADGHSHVGMH